MALEKKVRPAEAAARGSHWAATLAKGDTVLLVSSVRKQLASGKTAGDARVVKVIRGATRGGYVTVRGKTYGPIGSLLNRSRIFEKPDPSLAQTESSEISWLEQDTPTNRLAYELSSDGTNLRRKRERSKGLRQARDAARAAAIREHALELYALLEAVSANGGIFPSEAAADWKAIQEDVAIAAKLIR